LNLTAADSSWSAITASLTDGSTLQSEFMGGTPPVLAALSPTLSVAAGATVDWTTQALVLNNGVPMSGQAVAWQSGGSGITPQGTTAAISNGSGIAQKSLTVGPLTEGQQAALNACLNGTSQCVSFSAFGARTELATLEAVSGTVQSLAVSGTPGQITLRVLDVDGNPMAGGAVTFYQALYAWAPPCPVRGRCAQAELLTAQVATAVSALDGTVTFTPAVLPGVATNLVGLAVIGNAGTASVAVEQHP
jgi:hypothetical protein